MKLKSRFFTALLLIIGLAILITACNMPSSENDGTAAQTSIAETVAAALPANTPIPTNTTAPVAGNDGTGGNTTGGDTTGGNDSGGSAAQPTNTTAASGGNDNGPTVASEDDKAEFVSDISIPDYSVQEPGDEITKVWRLKNVGTTTWTTDYNLTFMSGEQLGAPDKVPLPYEVKPDGFLDISVTFTVPSAAGEYRSDWIFENGDGEQFGTGDDFQQSIYMIITVEGNGGSSSGGSSSSGGIPGGATVTNATVTVDQPNYTGSCPATLTFTYTVTTSNAGQVDFNLVFNAISPSGYSFDPPPQYTVNFTGGYTVTYTYTFLPSSSVTATARVKATGSNVFTSDSINFSVKCN